MEKKNILYYDSSGEIFGSKDSRGGKIPATVTSSLRAPGALPLTCIFNQTFPI
jgi:hypothetical protein